MQCLLRIVSPLVFCKIVSTHFVFYSISFLSLSLFFYTMCYVFLLSCMYPVWPLVAYYPCYRSRMCLPECVWAAPLHAHDHLARFLCTYASRGVALGEPHANARKVAYAISPDHIYLIYK